QANLVLETQDKVNITEQDIVRALSLSEKEKREALLKGVKRITKPPPLAKSMALLDGPATPSFVLHRGDYNQPAEQVAPTVPEVISQAGRTYKSRADLADW